MSHRNLTIQSIVLVGVLLFTSFIPTSAQAAPGAGNLVRAWVPAKPAHAVIQAWQSHNAIEVKFVEGSSYRLRNGALTTLGNDDLAGLRAALQAHPVSTIQRIFTQDEDQIRSDRLSIEKASGEQVPDLNLWYLFTVASGVDAAALIDSLNALPQVELAYAAPLPAGFPAVSAQPARQSSAVAQLSPSFVADQGYLAAAPGGIDAQYARTRAGGSGGNVIIADVEYALHQTHEDLKSVQIVGGQQYLGYGDDHGTAVMGELMGKNNAYGVTGIAYDATIKMSPACMDSACSDYDPANAINTARLNTRVGDVILIEQQTSVCGLSDYGPLEWYLSIYDAIKTSTLAGRTVVEAAGNGSVDLDQVGCGGLFTRSTRDSGAIIVGAGAPPSYSQADRSRLYFSSYGSRVDVQGWGDWVTTTGYGNLYVGSGPDQWYTSTFSGTSSASPIVAGAAALLSSIAKQRSNVVTSAWIRSTLASTGSPQQADPSYPLSQNIGPRPNLRAAIARLPSVGFNSQFTSGASGWTAVNGSWAVNLTNGMYFTNGAPLNYWHSATHSASYATLTYQARLKRTVCSYCANVMLIRGTPGSFDTTGAWSNVYMFEYQNSSSAVPARGGWSVFKMVGGTPSPLVAWTASSYILPYGFNTLKVTAAGSALKFYINDHLVWSGTDTSLSAGQVGLAMYQGNTSPTKGLLYVDWATLTNTVSASAALEDPGASPADVSAGDITGAPR